MLNYANLCEPMRQHYKQMSLEMTRHEMKEWNTALQKSHDRPGNHHILATSKNVHLLVTGADDPLLWLSHERQWVKGHQYWWLAGGYDLETTF